MFSGRCKNLSWWITKAWFWNFDQKILSYLFSIWIFLFLNVKSIVFCCRFEIIAIVVVLVSRQTLPLEKWSSSKKSMLRFVGFNWNISLLTCWTARSCFLSSTPRRMETFISQKSSLLWKLWTMIWTTTWRWGWEYWFYISITKRTWRFCNIKVRVVKMSMISRWGTFLMSWTRKTRRSPWRSSRSWWWLWRRLAGGNRNLRRWIIVHH